MLTTPQPITRTIELIATGRPGRPKGAKACEIPEPLDPERYRQTETHGRQVQVSFLDRELWFEYSKAAKVGASHTMNHTAANISARDLLNTTKNSYGCHQRQRPKESNIR